MSLSRPRVVYGIHSFTPYSLETGEYYGILKVLEGSAFNLNGEIVPLRGGSQPYPWAIEDGDITAEINLRPSQYEDFLIELFLGKKPTANAAENDASVTAITNNLGSLVGADGIDSVGVVATKEAEVKFAKYVVKAISATQVHVFASTDADFARTGAIAYQDDALRVTETPLTIVAATAVEIPGTGLELTGGAGPIAMNEGDTAQFQARPRNSASMDARIGGVEDVFPEFGAIMMAKKLSNGQLFEIEAFRCKGIGQNFGLDRNTWSQSDITAEAFYDESKNGIADIRHVTPLTAK